MAVNPVLAAVVVALLPQQAVQVAPEVQAAYMVQAAEVAEHRRTALAEHRVLVAMALPV
jgi:hypothetical protein